MASIELVVLNPSGLHARPAALFVQAASTFVASISVENLDRGRKPVDAKSILMLMAIGVSKGHRIRITADGPDEEEALRTLRAEIESGLGEPVGS